MIVNLLENEQRKHKNGGGWVALTAEVADSVFVAPFAIVYGSAEITGKVRVLDFAQISGHVKLSGDVVVSGHCWLDGNFKASTGHFHRNDRVVEKQQRIR
jgi:acyl-[acyl carrier protein]--UDP-N-acetylglucosamine O-acyltransferase